MSFSSDTARGGPICSFRNVFLQAGEEHSAELPKWFKLIHGEAMNVPVPVLPYITCVVVGIIIRSMEQIKLSCGVVIYNF